MSVVNTMLRELAARQQNDTVIPLPIAATAAPSVHRHWLWRFLAVIIAASTILVWRWQHQVVVDTAGNSTGETAPALTTNDAAPPTAMSAPFIASEATHNVALINETLLPARSGAPPVPTAAEQTKPATIGWELVTPDETYPEADGYDDDLSAPAIDGVTTVLPHITTPAAAPAVFERQPAQLTVDEQLAQLREQAYLALSAGDSQGAQRAIERGLLLRADDIALQTLQLQQIALHDIPTALQQAQKNLQISPSHWPVRQWLGSQLLQQQQAAQAREVLSLYAPTLTEAPDYHAVLALAEQQTGDHTAAISRYRSLVTLQPAQGRHSAGLALSLESMGERAAAVPAWRLALRDPTLPSAVASFARQRLHALLATAETARVAQ